MMTDRTRDVAIIGYSCRFAEANDIQTFWKNMIEGRASFNPIPESRWKVASFFSEHARTLDRTYIEEAAFIDDVESFASLHFGIAPRRVEVMDPQHRLVLDAVRVALQDAGYENREMEKDRVGTFLGLSSSDHRVIAAGRTMAMMAADNAFGDVFDESLEGLASSVGRVTPVTSFSIPGTLLNMAAANVAYQWKFGGPAFTMDAACASSLVAVHDAVTHIRAGICDAAVAGGVYLNLTPDPLVGFARIGAISRQGACRPFDAEGDGFVAGDGCGIVILKRMDLALKDGDRIHAVIRGTGVNNDAGESGPMAPCVPGQVAVIRQALADAGIQKANIGYLECHGTATPVGDPVEVESLSIVFQDGTDRYLGSVKGNVGHTLAAAGIAGMLRAVLAVETGVIPPQAGFQNPHPALLLDERHLRVPTEPTPWHSSLRSAGVSSFGFGGTNCHVILEQAPEVDRIEDTQPHLVVVTAPTMELLARHLDELRVAIAEHRPHLQDVAFTMNARRRHESCRAAFVVKDSHHLIELMRAAAPLVAAGNDGQIFDNVFVQTVVKTPKIAVLFPGQGAQRTHMMRDLYERYLGFTHRLNHLAAASNVPELLEVVYPEIRTDAAEFRLKQTQYTQPAMALLSLSLWRFLESLGLHAELSFGHSLGEFVAFAAHGGLRDEDLMELVALRGQWMQNLDLDDPGKMLAVRAGKIAVAPHIADSSVQIANINHPEQLVLSGTSSAIDVVNETLKAHGFKTHELNVSHAFHCELLQPITSKIGAHLGSLVCATPLHEVWSCTAQKTFEATNAAAILTAHATAPVDFEGAVEHALQQGIDLFVEIGPGVLSAMIPRIAGSRATAVAMSAAEPNDTLEFLHGTGRLLACGVPLNLDVLYEGSALVTLPATPLITEKYSVIRETSKPPIFERKSLQNKVLAPTAQTSVEEGPMSDLHHLVNLFQQQNQILAQHAEVIAAQTRALAALGVHTNLNVSDVLGNHTDGPVFTPALNVPERTPVLVAASTPLVVEAPTDWWPLVKKCVAAVSAFPVDSLQPQQVLATELGFDSLMFVELATALQKDIPGLTIPQAGFTPRTRLKDIVENLPGWLNMVPETNHSVVEDTPLHMFAPTWTRRAILQQRLEDLRGQSFRIYGEFGLKDDLESALICRGAALDASSRQVILFATGEDSSLRVFDVVQGLAAQNTLPDLFTVVTHDDIQGAAITGMAKAIAQEWPDSRVKVVFSTTHTTADQLVDEIANPVHESPVRLGEFREVQTFVRATTQAAGAFKGLRIAVSGGARGVGFYMAQEVANEVESLTIIGRTPEARLSGDDLKNIAELRNQTLVTYLQWDVAVEADAHVRSVLSNVDGIIHAAGILRDNELPRLTREDFTDVWSVKVAGIKNLMAALTLTPHMVVGVSSWAARFGNRGQSAYAAANAALGAWLESVRNPDTRTLVHEWPLWDETPMASTLSEAAKGHLKTQGVPILSAHEGRRLFRESLAFKDTILTCGRALDSLESKVLRRTVVSAATMPWVEDHRLRGTAILPFAAALELGLRQSLTPERTRTIKDFTLYRGIEVHETSGMLRTGEKDGKIQITGDVLHYAGELVATSLSASQVSVQWNRDVPTQPTPVTLSLQEFYESHSFHGPRMRAIEALETVNDSAIVGRVLTSSTDLLTGLGEGPWVCDPFVVDGGFQLVLYWLRHTLGVSAFPTRVEQFTVLGRPSSASVRVRLVMDSRNTEEMVGTIIWEDLDGRPLIVAERLHAQLLEDKTTQPKAPKVDKQYWDINSFPEVTALQQRLEMAAMIGVQNPYFRQHDGIAKNRAVIDGKDMLNFSSYNYLGLSGHPKVSQAAKDAVEHYGTSVSASRLASGQIPLHGELEQAIAEFVGVEASLIFSAGHHTNESVIGHIFSKGDLILHDALAHNSILTGAEMSGAKRLQFPHNDHEALERMLVQLRPSFNKVGVIIEGVYSMDGDIPNLPAFLEVKERHKCLLYVDEAHSVGCIGPRGAGVADYYGLDARRVDLWMGTLSKSFASCGGYIAGSKALIDYLKYTVPGFIFSAGISPANSAAALASVQIMTAEPERIHQLQARAKTFLEACQAHGIDTGPSKDSAVVPAIVGNSFHCLQLSEQLGKRGINVQPIVYPAVDDEASRLRFFISSTHTNEELLWCADVLAEELQNIRNGEAGQAAE